MNRKNAIKFIKVIFHNMFCRDDKSKTATTIECMQLYNEPTRINNKVEKPHHE